MLSSLGKITFRISVFFMFHNQRQNQQAVFCFSFFGSWGKGSFNRILHSSHLVLTQSLSSCLFDLISILFSWNLRQDQHRPPPPPTSNSSSSTITTFTHGCRRSVRLSLNQIQFCPVWFHPSPTQNRGIRHAVDSIFIQPAQRFSLSASLFLFLSKCPVTPRLYATRICNLCEEVREERGKKIKINYNIIAPHPRNAWHAMPCHVAC